MMGVSDDMSFHLDQHHYMQTRREGGTLPTCIPLYVHVQSRIDCGLLSARQFEMHAFRGLL